MSSATRERGATAVEVALTLPVVLAVVGLVVTVGWGMALRGLLHRGAEAGARAAAVVVEPGVRTVERYRSDAEVLEAVRAGTVLLGDAVTVTVDWPDVDRGEGARLAVTASYTLTSPAAALMAPLAGAERTSEGIAFTASAERRRE